MVTNFMMLIVEEKNPWKLILTGVDILAAGWCKGWVLLAGWQPQGVPWAGTARALSDRACTIVPSDIFHSVIELMVRNF